MSSNNDDRMSDTEWRQFGMVLFVALPLVFLLSQCDFQRTTAGEERQDQQRQLSAAAQQRPMSEDELREAFVDAMAEEFAIEMDRVEREFGRTYIPVRYPNGGWPQGLLLSSGQAKVIDCILVPTTTSGRNSYWSATVEVEAFDDLDREYRVRLVGVIDAGEPVNERREWEFGRRTMSFSYGRNTFNVSAVIPKNLVQPIHRVEVVLEELEPLRR